MIKKLIQKSYDFNPSNRYQRSSLTRMRTHLNEEYLEDLMDLLPGRKTTEEQSFSDAKIRITSSSSLSTKGIVTDLRDLIKKRN